MLYELNEAYDLAMADDEVKVVILAAKGPHFSAGHDLSEGSMRKSEAENKRVTSWVGGEWDGAEAYYMREKEIYEGFCVRWRGVGRLFLWRLDSRRRRLGG